MTSRERVFQLISKEFERQKDYFATQKQSLLTKSETDRFRKELLRIATEAIACLEGTRVLIVFGTQTLVQPLLFLTAISQITDVWLRPGRLGKPIRLTTLFERITSLISR